MGFPPLPMNRVWSSSANRFQFISEPTYSLSYKTKSTISSYSSSSSSLRALVIPQSSPISNPLYRFLPETQNPNNLVNFISSALKQSNSQTSLYRNDWQNIIPHLGTQEISRVLLRCQSEPHSALVFFKWVKNDLAIRPNPHNYCIIVHILVWSRKFIEGMEYLSELIQLASNESKSIDVFESLVFCTNDCNWDPVVFDMLIKAYVKDGQIGVAYRAFRKMVKLGYVPHVLAFNCLLNGISKLDCIDKCWELYREMWRIGIIPNTCTFNMFTHLLCKDNSVDRVNEFLDKMEEEGFVPDLVTYNTLISSYCRKCRLDDAFYLYKIMYRRGVMPDLVTYTSLMSGLCKIAKVKEAHQVFHRMIDRGFSPDIVSYNTLIHGYCREGRMKESRLLVHEMIGNGRRPDNFTCQILVEGFGKTGRWHSCLNMVVELRRFEVLISSEIYKYLIVSLSQENRPFVAITLLEKMMEDGHKPNDEIYYKLIQSLCCTDHIEKALLLKNNMLGKSINLSLDMYQNLISCLCRLKRCSEAESLIKEMVSNGLKPDENISRALIFGYCKEQNIDKAECLLVSLATEYHLYDLYSYNALVKAWSERCGATELMELQDKMHRLGFMPNSLTCKYVIHGMQNAVRRGTGQVEEKNHLTDHDFIESWSVCSHPSKIQSEFSLSSFSKERVAIEASSRGRKKQGLVVFSKILRPSFEVWILVKPINTS